jgi:hypothetical protein
MQESVASDFPFYDFGLFISEGAAIPRFELSII